MNLLTFMHIALVAIFVSLSVPGFVIAIRELPTVTRWVVAGVKPWSCDYCMCFWSTGIWVGSYAWLMEDPRILFACGPAYSLALLLLAYMQRPPPGSGPPGVFPDAPEEPGLAEKLEGEA